MARSQLGAQVGSLARRLRILDTHLSDRLRLHRLGNGPGLAARALQHFYLFEAGTRLGGAGARVVELVVDLGELLLVHEHTARAQDIVLGLVTLDAVFRLADAAAQLVEPRRERRR